MARNLGLIVLPLLATTTLLATPQDHLASVQAAISRSGGTQQIKSLHLKGRFWTSQFVHRNLTTGESAVIEDSGLTEIKVLIPDYYLDIKASERLPRRVGFAAGRGLPSGSPVAFARERASCTRLLLGLLGRRDCLPDSTVQKNADGSLTITGPDSFNGTLFLNRATNLPERLVYRDRMGVLAPGPVKGVQRGQPTVGMTRGPTSSEVEVEIRFDLHRDVKGFNLPFKISWTAKGIRLWELELDDIIVDALLAPSDFVIK